MDSYDEEEMVCINTFCYHNSRYGQNNTCCLCYVRKKFVAIDTNGTMKCVNFKRKENLV